MRDSAQLSPVQSLGGSGGVRQIQTKRRKIEERDAGGGGL